MDIWYSLWKFGIFFPALVFCTKKNLATLVTKQGPMLQFQNIFAKNGEKFAVLTQITYVLLLRHKKGFLT
jgi:hypothetical protein